MSSPEHPPWTGAERELRGQLEPSEAQLTRIVQRALDEPPASFRRPLAASLALAASLILAAGLLWVRWSPDGGTGSGGVPEDVPGNDPGAAAVTATRAAEVHGSPDRSYQLVNTGGVVAVTTPSGQIQAIVAGGTS